MRTARTIAAFVALATVAFTVGDFASHPNPLGALGILVLIALFAGLLAYLFRPQRERVEPAPAPPPAPRPEPRPRADAAGVWSEGWDAGEADTARQRRRRGPGRGRDRS